MDAAEDDRLDRDLVEQAQRGDREAFAILARTHGDRLMAIAQRILRDVGRAEDAVQQTLVIAWRELPASAIRTASTPGSSASSSMPSYAEARRCEDLERERPHPAGRRTGRAGRVDLRR